MNLDRLSVRDRTDLVDSRGRTVVLRGMVTITSDHRGPLELEGWHYDQMADFGFNVQQIRLEGARLGVLDGTRDPAYLDKVDRWVTMGAERGLYSLLKMTTYDVPSIGGAGRAFDPELWQQFWDRDDWRQNRIDAWAPIWERLAGRPEVVGYDLLNEPVPGTDTPDFVTNHLIPFYEAAATRLRSIDREACVVVQPGAGLEAGGGDPGPLMSDPLTVYAPHFYPDIFEPRGDDEYAAFIDAYRAQGRRVGGPTIFGEFGNPTEIPSDAFGGRIRTFDPVEERRKGEVLDRKAMSAIRPWYVDEGWWGVLDPGYKENERTAALVRPYVARVPGGCQYFTTDDDAGRFEARVDIGGASNAPVVLAVPAAWAGSAIAVDGGGAGTVTARDVAVAVPPGEHVITVQR